MRPSKVLFSEFKAASVTLNLADVEGSIQTYSSSEEEYIGNGEEKSQVLPINDGAYTEATIPNAALENSDGRAASKENN